MPPSTKGTVTRDECARSMDGLGAQLKRFEDKMDILMKEMVQLQMSILQIKTIQDNEFAQTKESANKKAKEWGPWKYNIIFLICSFVFFILGKFL